MFTQKEKIIMDLLTRPDLVSLARSRTAGPAVSLSMPTHRSGDAI